MAQGLPCLCFVPDQDPEGCSLPVRQHLEHRLGRSPVAQHCHIRPHKADARRLEHPVKAQVIGVVSLHPVGGEGQGVHRFDFFRFRGDVCQIGDHPFLIGNGHIAAPEPLRILPDEPGNLFRFPFQQRIGIPRAHGLENLLMDLGRQTVPQDPSQQSEFHDACSSFP